MRSRVLALFAAMVVTGCQPPAPDPRTVAPMVAVVTAGEPATATQQFIGVVKARVESDLGFRVGGKVVERLVDSGEPVHQGQILMRLDPTDLALGAAMQRSAVAVAQARSLQATADFGRLQGLVAQGAISVQAYDAAKQVADSARAQLEAAAAQSRVAGNARSYAVLRADADGIVQETLAEPGQVIAAGQTVVKLAHSGSREAVVDLPETGRPALGSTARAVMYGNETVSFPAVLRQLSESADPITRTYQARYVLQGEASHASLGATVTVALPLGSEGTEVPIAALYDPGSGPGVWTIESDRVRFHSVHLLALQNETASVSGLNAGSRIVALGAELLREGELVRPTSLPGTRRSELQAR